MSSVALGLASVGYGLALGTSNHFTNWGIVAFMVGVGAVLLAGAAVLKERTLVLLFSGLLIANAAIALYAFLGGIRGAN